jgi:chorismate mutase / prephenate dehydratase
MKPKAKAKSSRASARAPAHTAADIPSIRKEIDALDDQILALLNRRTAHAVEIGRLKKVQASGAYVPAREKEVFDRLCRQNKGPLTDRNLRAIYREIMSASLSLENEVRVAFLGPASTYSHQAAKSRFGDSVDYVLCDSIAEVFATVEKGAAHYGVVPIENSIEGGVTATQDALSHTRLRICSELYLPIAHHLLAPHGTDEKSVRRIYSKQEALSQCRGWLEKHHPRTELVPVASTARGAQMAAAEKGAAAIAGILAAELYKLDTLASNIQDVSGNTTRFLVLGEAYGRPTGADKTSIYFGVQHKVGALMTALQCFEGRKLNLLKIESRPSKAKAWEYFFFADFEGHADDAPVREALAEVRSHCQVLHVLGSYPRVND